METAKGDRISDLPKEILQRIVYFLSQEDAVRTSALSKSWRYIWCSRPNLHFSDKTFKGSKQDFLFAVDNSLQRYSDQRLSLDEFHLTLSMDNNNFNSNHDAVSLVEKWIPLLTTMGVKEFHLSIAMNYYADLPTAVFTAESLKLLHLHDCELGRRKNIPENIPFDRLEQLRLRNVIFIKNEIFDTIISSCPLLTTMWLEKCTGLKTIKLDKKLHKHLKHFTFISAWTHRTHNGTSSIVIDLPTLETIEIRGSKIRFHGHKFCNLKSLSLKRVEISSNSVHQQSELLCIDAPNIECFDYSGFFIPSISFTPPNSGKSSLEMYIDDDVEDAQSWFVRLSKLLQALRQSEISLDIVNLSTRNNLHIEQDILVHDTMNGGNRPVVVEHLQLSILDLSSWASVLNGLFCICRPVKITPIKRSLCWGLARNREQKELADLFSNIQMMRESGNQRIWQDFEDLTIERCDTSRREWEPLRGTTLLECALLNINHLRFLLKWSEA